MEIIDIQELSFGKFEITFGNESGDDIIKIIISKEDMWFIHDYCQDKLSYKAQLKDEK